MPPTVNFVSLVFLTAIIYLFGNVGALECYVCTQQEGNVEKCLSTVRTCDYEEDTCLTEVRWGSTPYWSQGAEKQYYVTKTCATRQYCEQRRQDFVSYCHRIWYEDWKCAECCQGDRCNYFAFMGAGTTSLNLSVFILSLLLTLKEYFHL
ncbi:uncharacterized protein LOC110842173 [Folsomia candida]|uniref:Uncharacterized protein n=1 Tax=Folsomia candida TaxID=158441 RepID=A0A226F2W5_FOLCA|nr:uncharacterized protein LOC110842173 [Folsomia candida]XP_035702750.1 uncharacterized protein LOC110842173 [Folsomia candida]OXA63690.1 hypothetical protein Fcan01_01974 [Folsomia candida]